jgi:hypothetical protein
VTGQVEGADAEAVDEVRQRGLPGRLGTGQTVQEYERARALRAGKEVGQAPSVGQGYPVLARGLVLLVGAV